MLDTFKLKKPATYLRITAGSLLFYVATTLFLIWPTISPIIKGDFLTINKKLLVVFQSLFSLADFYTIATGVVTILNAVLFGLVVHLLWIQIKNNCVAGRIKVFGRSAIATILATIGAGCAACGSLVIGPLLATIGAAGLLSALPGHGVEFALLGTVLLIYSIWDLYKKIRSPLVCKL